MAELDATKCTIIASFTVMIYDIAITLDDEVRYFWQGRWDLSRILFLINRYSLLVNMILIISYAFNMELSKHSCDRGLQVVFVLSALSLFIIQAIMVIRVWYLFTKSRIIRQLIVCAYIISCVSTLIILAFFLHRIPRLGEREPPGTTSHTCTPILAMYYWRLIMSSLVLHVILFGLTVYRSVAYDDPRSAKPVLKRLVRDGGVFLSLIFCAAILAGIASFTNESHPQISAPIIASNCSLVIASISVSRVMLSIHSLAAKLRTTPNFLLNPGELSRLNCRPGRDEREIYVERLGSHDQSEYDHEQRVGELETESYGLQTKSPMSTGSHELLYVHPLEC